MRAGSINRTHCSLIITKYVSLGLSELGAKTLCNTFFFWRLKNTTMKVIQFGTWAAHLKSKSVLVYAPAQAAALVTVWEAVKLNTDSWMAVEKERAAQHFTTCLFSWQLALSADIRWQREKGEPELVNKYRLSWCSPKTSLTKKLTPSLETGDAKLSRVRQSTHMLSCTRTGPNPYWGQLWIGESLNKHQTRVFSLWRPQH